MSRAPVFPAEDLAAALGESHVELRVRKKSAEGRLAPFEDLKVIRQDAAVPVSRFCRLAGRPRRRRRSRWTAGPAGGVAGRAARTRS